jgi:hypothetical protein
VTKHIFILTMVHPSLLDDYRHSDLIEEALNPGQPFSTLELAQKAAQKNIDDDYTELHEDEETPATPPVLVWDRCGDMWNADEQESTGVIYRIVRGS